MSEPRNRRIRDAMAAFDRMIPSPIEGVTAADLADQLASKLEKYAYFRMPIDHTAVMLTAMRTVIEDTYAFAGGSEAEPVGVEGDEILYRIAVPGIPDYRA